MINLKYTPNEDNSIDINEEVNGEGRYHDGSRKQVANADEEGKGSALSKYQESEDENYIDDFNLEGSDDLNLSYSKFSHVSGISFLTKKDSGSQGDILESPFVKNIQYKLQEARADGTSDSKSKFVMKRRKNSDLTGLQLDKDSIHSAVANNENESPFIERLPESNHVSRSTLLRKGVEPSENEPRFSNIHHNSKASGISPRRAGHSARLSTSRLQSTPDYAQKSSIKVSLTPAQRFEKKSGFNSSNGLENFQITNLVGRGAFANVYKGINLKTKQTLAIKQMFLERGQDVGQLMGEIDLLKILKHENIVKYHGFVKTSNTLNVFLEYCSGGSLRQLYKKLNHGLQESQIICFVRQILKGLSYLHAQGVVHRDVKAANVLMTENGTIKLADFGVATKVNSQHQTVVGTPNWMAPETVLGGEGLCTASDIWSLGATIIELFTTHPPYHELNAMATLHAIGTDEHPPLPKNISPLAKDFLLACFQKQPSLRSSAKFLLKHKWLLDEEQRKRNPSFNKFSLQGKESIPSNLSLVGAKEIKNYSETNEDNWEDDFANLPEKGIDRSHGSFRSHYSAKVSKNEILGKYLDTSDDFNFENDSIFNDPPIHNQKSQPSQFDLEQANDNFSEITENEDPFLEMDIEDFDTNELEISGRVSFLLNKLTNRVDLCHSGNDEVFKSLTKITGKLLHIVKKYPNSHDAIIRDHGLLTLTELLENAPEFQSYQDLWYHALAILNHVFDKNTTQLESFSLLGGIPLVTHFRNTSYKMKVRIEVLKFIQLLKRSDKAVSMFISCGGLRVLSKFIEEDFDSTPDFPLTAIDCIHNILTKDLARSKSNLCRILSKYGVIFWFVVLLNRLTKPDREKHNNQTSTRISSAVYKIIDIIKCFGQSEAKVRINISSSDLFKLLIKLYPNLQFDHQLVILKFIKSFSHISEVLKTLHSADILEFIVYLLEYYTPSRPHYKEVINIVCPILYNCCYLNHNKEKVLVQLGAVPMLKNLSKINLPFRQFVLPILCELVYCDKSVRHVLAKHDILSVYFNLLIDPYWQSNALDSMLNWHMNDPEIVDLESPKAVTFLVSGFMLPKVSNLESVLDNYLKLVTSNKNVCLLMIKDSLIDNILMKLKVHQKNSVVELSLLRILKNLVLVGTENKCQISSHVLSKVELVLESMKAKKSSVLVYELANETSSLLKDIRT
ncbi:Piso0_004522 [Millerozyma farinosa CBS 7064]|uniref:Piso0_004522 protein n=1 Tax=Pichia sorbitophila (strain ATCC MYA-4447 / BCRC 22081 / CBS 7064 / NBRC 10061 / NRRL Y-12695) TaxID=559304 RepID=G8Y911_PICSO|nr:Piso0_004522 [Millerozyma farinosa CBS 7064]CCE84956.1 Piso0_004522 [Millerozyma farinosa CBS 7064]